MKINLPLNLGNQEPDQDFVKIVASGFDLLSTIFSGRIGFIDNCATAFVPVTFITANVEQAVSHGLDRIPTGAIQVSSTASGVVYNGLSAGTGQYIYLKATLAGDYNVLIF